MFTNGRTTTDGSGSADDGHTAHTAAVSSTITPAGAAMRSHFLRRLTVESTGRDDEDVRGAAGETNAAGAGGGSVRSFSIITASSGFDSIPNSLCRTR